MKIKVQVVIESDRGVSETVENKVCLEPGALRPDNFGLILAEAKAILAGAQKTMIDQEACCPHCGKKRLHKGHHTLVYHSLFGMRPHCDHGTIFHRSILDR